MYKTDSRLQAIPEDTHISRYMDFVSFYSFLSNQTLYFRRLDKYSDQLEGQVFEETIMDYKKNILIKNPDINRNTLEEWALTNAEKIKGYKERTLSNSWNIGSEENYAMWKIYLRGSPEGVAIRTTAGKLIQQFEANPEFNIHCGKVLYEPFLDNDTNQFVVSTTKRKYYEYENEYRALIINQFVYGKPDVPIFPDGANVKINTSELVDKIYISPFATLWFRKVVESLIEEKMPGFTNIVSSGIQDK